MPWDDAAAVASRAGEGSGAAAAVYSSLVGVALLFGLVFLCSFWKKKKEQKLRLRASWQGAPIGRRGGGGGGGGDGEEEVYGTGGRAGYAEIGDAKGGGSGGGSGGGGGRAGYAEIGDAHPGAKGARGAASTAAPGMVVYTRIAGDRNGKDSENDGDDSDSEDDDDDDDDFVIPEETAEEEAFRNSRVVADSAGGGAGAGAGAGAAGGGRRIQWGGEVPPAAVVLRRSGSSRSSGLRPPKLPPRPLSYAGTTAIPFFSLLFCWVSWSYSR